MPAHPCPERQRAKSLGQKRYYIGPCKYGHDAERLVSNATCVECAEATRLRRVERVGELRYTTKPCKYGHVSPRATSNGSCLECSRLRAVKAYEVDPEPILARGRKWRSANPEKNKQAQENWKAANPGKADEATRRWQEQNPERCRVIQREGQRRRYANDIEHRLAVSLRNRINKALMTNTKSGSHVRDLGCTLRELRAHIEAQFSDGMQWDNWGLLWQLDHHRALGTFILTDRKQFLEACHYTNLRPILIEDHKTKTRLDRQRIAEAREARWLGSLLEG